MHCLAYMSLATLATMALAAPCARAQADAGVDTSRSKPSRWVRVAVDSDSDRYFIDALTIRWQGTSVIVWEEARYHKPEKTTAKWYARVRALEEFDCTGQQMRLLSSLSYSTDTSRGPANLDGLDRPSQWIPLAPGSVFESTGRAVCSLKRPPQR